MRLATKRLALPIALTAALAVAVPAIPAGAQPDEGGATASQRSKDPRDRRGDRPDPRCRIVERQQEMAAARVSQAQQKVRRAKAKLKNARAAAAEAEGKKAKTKAAKKVKKAKKGVKRAKKALRDAKAAQRGTNRNAEQRGC